jgi:hypothetical protein
VAIEISRYCVPWTPFRRPLGESTLMLVSTAGVHHRDDPPLDPEGDLGYRIIPGSARAEELRVSDHHYDHACVDADVNTVFPIDRLRELARDERRLEAVADSHFCAGYTTDLRRFKEATAVAVALAAAKERPDAVLLTGG